ncbi:hypothetical protein FRC11_013018 [Ceratobasidium sp. 423]|nr:hypothetical protein FRC11_013018 [Ceratobasidium sp. 423]
MESAFPSNVATPLWTAGRTSAQSDGTYPNNPMTTASSSPVPSRIPQPTRPPKDRAARQKVPGYAAPTAVSSQRQLPRIRSERLASRSSAGIALSNPATRHVPEGFVSKIPTRTKTRIETLSGSTLYTTPARTTQSSTQPVPTLLPTPNSPPPQYAEHSETLMQSYPENPPPSFSPTPVPYPPSYRAFKLKLELCIPLDAYEDESEEIVARLLQSLSDSLPESSLIRRLSFNSVLRPQPPSIGASSTERRQARMFEPPTRYLPEPIENDDQIVMQEDETPSPTHDSPEPELVDCSKSFYYGLDIHNSLQTEDINGSQDELRNSIIGDWQGNPDTAALFANLGSEV